MKYQNKMMVNDVPPPPPVCHLPGGLKLVPELQLEDGTIRRFANESEEAKFLAGYKGGTVWRHWAIGKDANEAN